SIEVERQAINTAGNVKYDDAIPLLIEKLVDKRIRREAREALLKFGDAVVPELERRLSDGAQPLAVRAQIPKVLAYTGTQEAADALLASLHRLRYELDYPVIKALNRMRNNWSIIRLNNDVVAAAIWKEREAYDRLRAILDSLQINGVEDGGQNRQGPGAVFSILIRAVQERLDQRLEVMFRLLALIHSPQDVYSAYYNCRARPALRASAIEFLDNLLAAEFKPVVIPLLEDGMKPKKA